jgi:hypothetical protein
MAGRLNGLGPRATSSPDLAERPRPTPPGSALAAVQATMTSDLTEGPSKDPFDLGGVDFYNVAGTIHPDFITLRVASMRDDYPMPDPAV